MKNSGGWGFGRKLRKKWGAYFLGTTGSISMRCPKMTPYENDTRCHCTRMTPLGLAKTVHEFPYKNWGPKFVLGHFRMRHFCYFPNFVCCPYENDTPHPWLPIRE